MGMNNNTFCNLHYVIYAFILSLSDESSSWDGQHSYVLQPLTSMSSNDKTPHLHTDWMRLGIGKIARWMIFKFPSSSNSPLNTPDANTHIILSEDRKSSNHALCFEHVN